MKGNNQQNRSSWLRSLFTFCLLGVLSYEISYFHGYYRSSYDTNEDNDTSSEEVITIRKKNKSQFQSTATICNKQEIHNLKSQGFTKSQSNEDIDALVWFNGLCNGRYIELGGYDGEKYSNTYVFNKAFDWHGLLIELNPNAYAQMRINRPNELANVNAAVCDKKGIVHFMDPGPNNGEVNGIWEFAGQNFRDQWWISKGLTGPEKGIPIECLPLQDIIVNNINTTHPVYKTHYFDLFSLDTEGAELSILRTIDFSTVGFGIIIVEADHTNERKNMALRQFLERQGYTFLYNMLGNEHRNYWFIHNDFDLIYNHLLYSN